MTTPIPNAPDPIEQLCAQLHEAKDRLVIVEEYLAASGLCWEDVRRVARGGGNGTVSSAAGRRHGSEDGVSHESEKFANQEITAEMARRGISCVPIDNFYYREFHYTTLHDAMAQSTRDRIRLGLVPE